MIDDREKMSNQQIITHVLQAKYVQLAKYVHLAKYLQNYAKYATYCLFTEKVDSQRGSYACLRDFLSFV